MTMTMQVVPTIDFGNQFRINLANERWQSQGFRLAVAGSSGSGKSYLVNVLLEELHAIGIPFLVIDPDGEYSALSQLDGVTVTDSDDARQVLAALNKSRGVVADISELAGSDQRLTYTQILTSLWKRQQKLRQAGQSQPLVLVVEEAHIFAPQKRQNDAESLEITVTIARRGRKYGVNTVFVSQRPGDLEKDVLGQSNIRIMLRLDLEHDFKAVKSLLPVGVKHNDLLALGTGEFFLRIGPDFHRLQPVRKRRTADLGSTPAIVYQQVSLFGK